MIVKYVPEWMPGAGFKTRAREGYPIARALLDKPYEEAKSRFVRALSILLFLWFPDSSIH